MNRNVLMLTEHGNLLVSVRGKEGGIVYMTPQGRFLPSKFEIKFGKPINHSEWNGMVIKIGSTLREATADESQLAIEAIRVRTSEFLSLEMEEERLAWKKGRDALASQVSQTYKPFESLKKILGR